MGPHITFAEKFNKNILAVVCIAGLIRVAVELILNTSQPGDLDFWLDLGYGFIFVVTLIAILTKSSYRLLYITFYVPLVILLCLTLFDRQGVASSSENNIYIGLMVIALTMSGSDAMKFSIILIAGSILALVLVEDTYHFFENYSGYATSNLNFIFMGIASVILTFHAKRVFENSKTKLVDLKQELSENQKVLSSSHAQLQKQTDELKELNKTLENKVAERMALLKNQRMAIKEYLDLTLLELQEKHQNIQSLTRDVIDPSEDEIAAMLKISSERLNKEMNTLVDKLNEEQ